MLLNKVTAAALLTLVALGSATSAAHAFDPPQAAKTHNSSASLATLKAEDDGHDDGWGGGKGGPKSHDKNDDNGWSAGSSDPLVMPPVVIKPDETETTPDTNWTPPSDGPSALPSPGASVLPLVDPQSMRGTGMLPSSVIGSTGGRHRFVVSPVSPADHPSLPGTQSLPGDSPTIHQSEQRIDPSRNQAVVLNRMSFSEQSPLQDFIDAALVVMAILGALSLGLVSVLVRSARVAKSNGR